MTFPAHHINAPWARQTGGCRTPRHDKKAIVSGNAAPALGKSARHISGDAQC